ncbi:hypothetical protein HPG69_002799 [Diceros bicornis minor]|uniref:Uncharacterized protein n=1 Tax=Diceros bicornis minor TaxID=77932 RepID=A0A7J7ER35_DICBM|nr:hypothetical protein HPG69_002799 [Diceros bicornis minor]
MSIFYCGFSGQQNWEDCFAGGPGSGRNGADFSEIARRGIGNIITVLLGMFRVHRRGVINMVPFLHALTCGLPGYVSSHFCRQIGGEHLVWNIILTTGLFSGEDFPFPGVLAWT